MHMEMSVSSKLISALCMVLLVGCASAAGRSTTEGTTLPVELGDLPTGFPRTCALNEVQVMLLGTYHFEGSTSDAVSGTPQDVRAPVRQAELEDLVDRLARWSPQQIVVEWPFEFADSAKARYERYIETHGATTSKNEVVQIGFRLARRMAHPTVYPIDHQMPLGNDSLAALLVRQPVFQRHADSVIAALRADAKADEQTNATLPIVERLRRANEDAALHAGNSGPMFGSWLATGEGTNRGGPQLLARWYERNLYMAHNLTRVLRPGTRRLIVLVGSGHVPPLRNILDESPHFCPVSPLPFLR
jgi:hypothetical protein